MSAEPWNLVTLAPLSPAMANGALGDLPIVVVTPDRDDHDAVGAALAEAELLLYDWRASATGLSAADVAAAPRLAFVQQPSVGVPGHDLAALDGAGIALANAAGFNAVAVAEWVLGALLAVARHLTWVEGELRAGRWPQVDVIARGPIEIGGRRVGIVGFGPIAHAVVAPLLAMGCSVSYWSRSRRAPEDEHGATYRDLDELVATSDVLINLIALGDTTRGLLSASRLATLPAGAIVVSASRGGIVDESAVLDGVATGHLAGAAFDVFATEPLPADSPLRANDRILLTSHTAGTTKESFVRMTDLLADNIRRAVTGQPVRNLVNGVDPVVRRR
jgi:D-3-phosphoglycerate dehydrogenase / 2-oxoglutarate reductase